MKDRSGFFLKGFIFFRVGSTFLSALRKASFIRDEETWLSLKFLVQSERYKCVYVKDRGTECSSLCPAACSVNYFSSNLKQVN